MAEALFPATRLRRLRQSPWIRDLTAESRLHASDLIWPIFIQEGSQGETPIASLPGVSRFSIDRAIKEAKALHALGLKAVALFPIVPVERKTAHGREALQADNLLCRALRAFKQEIPTLGLIADVALDPYTTHGHDGVLNAKGDDVDNDATVSILAEQACVLAHAGADVVAPSDMMDGRVAAIRHALEKNGFHQTLILAYSAKYASALYGPFREAVGSARQENSSTICKSGYQMSPANGREARREAALDIAEGADMLMVKPGLPYLDIVYQLSQSCDLPVMAYHVSGEYASVMFAAAAGALDADSVFYEHMLCFKRAGARAILSYATPMLLKKMLSA